MKATDEQSVLEARVIAGIKESAAGSFDDRSFAELALAMHEFQRRHNVAYDRYCRALGTPMPLADWRRIPGVPQQAFKHAELRTFPADQTTATFHTSGTTGEGPGRHHFRSLALYEQATRAGWRQAGLPQRRPQFILIPPPAEAPRSSLSHMMGAVGEFATEQIWCAHVTDGAMSIDLAAFADRVEVACGPVVVLGTALSFLHVFERLGERRLHLPEGSIALETGGYKGSGRALTKAELYASFESRLGLVPESIWNEYGMTELSSQCYARGLNEPHRAPPWLRALVIDPATNEEVQRGGTGVLKLIDLANVGSVVGIQTQDLAVRRDAGAFELLGRDPAALPRGCSRAADEMLSVPS